jgi:hypothetical protein
MSPPHNHKVAVNHSSNLPVSESSHVGKATNIQPTDLDNFPLHQTVMSLPPPSRGLLVLVPQSCIISPTHAGSAEATRRPTITFQSKKHNAELGMRVGEILSDDLSCAPFDLIGAMDGVFQGGEKYITINLAVKRLLR